LKGREELTEELMGCLRGQGSEGDDNDDVVDDDVDRGDDATDGEDHDGDDDATDDDTGDVGDDDEDTDMLIPREEDPEEVEVSGPEDVLEPPSGFQRDFEESPSVQAESSLGVKLRLRLG
jgi:hypothetical protein